MSMQKKAKKRLILSSAAIVLAAGLGVGGWLFWQYRNDQKTVEVQPVSYLSTSYWGDTAQSSGTITKRLHPGAVPGLLQDHHRRVCHRGAGGEHRGPAAPV